MKDASATARASGVGFFGLLAILFIALKLLGYIAWSWWWVLSPIWIPWAIIGVVCVVLIICWLVTR